MSTAILKTDGTAVNIDSFTDAAYDVSGFLLQFTFTTPYIYRQVTDFRTEDLNQPNLEGYYELNHYLGYIQYLTLADNSTSFVELITKYKFDFTNYLAKIGDAAVVSVVDITAPYATFYSQSIYSFNVEVSIDGTTPRTYKKPVYDNLQIVDQQFDPPQSAIKSQNTIDLSATPIGWFYKKNFSDNTSNTSIWNISDIQIQRFKQLAIKVAMKINFIVKDIFPLLVTTSEMATIDAEADSTDPALNDLNDLQKAIFLMKKTWAYYYEGSGAPPEYIHRTSFDPVFSTEPIYEEYTSYYAGLFTFYDTCYKTQSRLAIAFPSDKFKYLLSLLPVTALTIFPLSFVTSILDELIKAKNFSLSDQDFIVRLTDSISDSNINGFLAYLLSMNDGQTSNLEALFSNLSDARLSRIPFIKYIVNNVTYKKYFIFSLLQLWQKSEYNFNYFPPGQSGTGINLNSYFITHLSEFNQNNVLYFQSSQSDPDENSEINTTIKFTSEFAGSKIKVSTVTDKKTTYLGVDNNVTLDNTETKYFGSFHMYQVITLVGYHPNLEFALPERASLPTFMFRYIEEYTDQVDFDAGVALAIDLSVIITLAFFTGGESLLADFNYIRFLPDMGKAMLGELPTTETVTVWATTSIGDGTAYTLAASSLGAINSYLITNETDARKLPILLLNQKIILALLLLTGTDNLLARSGVILDANESVSLINGLPADVDSGVSQDFMGLLDHVAGQKALVVGQAASGYEDLSFPVGVTNNISEFYNGLTPDQQFSFWQAFPPTANLTDLSLLNSNPQYLQNWLSLSLQNLAEANRVDFVTNQALVDGLIRFSNSSALKNDLLSLSYSNLLLFLTKYGDESKLSATQFTLLEQYSPYAIRLLFSTLNPVTGVEYLTADNIFAQLNSNFKESHIKFLLKFTQYSLQTGIENFESDSDIQLIGLDQLEVLFNKYSDVPGLSPEQKDNIKSSNKLDVSFDVMLNGVKVGDTIFQYFISGSLDKMLENFTVNGELSLPSELTEISDDDFNRLKLFGIKAFSGDGRYRTFDTEMKFIFKFLDDYYDTGDEFVFTFSSTYYACENCRRFLGILRNMALDDNKSIKIIFISDPSITGYSVIKQLF